MPTLTNRLYLTFLDHRGQIAKVAICVLAAVVDPSGAAVTTIRAAIVGVSNAINSKASIAIPAPIVDTPTSGAPYEDADKLMLMFQSSNNSYSSFRIPAPIAAVWAAGSTEEADPDAVPVANIVATILASCKQPGGAGFVAFKGGRRIRL